MVYVFLIALLVSILQLTALTYTRIGPFAFDLRLIILVFFSLRKGFKIGTALGLFFGIFNGLFGIGAFWLNIFLYSLIGFIIGYVGDWFYKDNLLTFLLMVFCSMTFIYFSYCILKLTYLPVELNCLDYTLRLFLPSVAYNMVASMFLFYFLRNLYPVRNTEYK